MRVLHVLSELGGGGVASLLLNYYPLICDRCKFDFVVTGTKEGIRESIFKEWGCNVYHIPEMHKSIRVHIKLLGRIIKDGNYDIVHAHGDYKGFFSLYYSKKYGVKVRIAQSHRTLLYSKIDRLQSRIFIPLTKKYATHLAACGRDAAIAIWGYDDYNDGKIHIIRNAIPVEKFSFNLQQRNIIRKEYGLTDKYVIGNIGRLDFQKNQLFLIDIFAKIQKKYPSAYLIIVGDGDQRKILENRIRELSLSASVLLMGIREDVPDLMNSFDVFVLPSIFEGLPVTLVEAQANGIPCVVSDTITDEVKFSEHVAYLNLSDKDTMWVDAICKAGNRYKIDISQLGYDIKIEANNLVEFYESGLD